MAKLASYKIDSMQESFSSSVNVTSYPAEEGLPLNDSVQRNPKTYSISGKILRKKSKDAEEVRKKLENYSDTGKLVKYVGRIKASNVLITNFDGTYDATVGNGLSFSMNLQQVRITKTPYVKKKTKKKTSGKKTVSKKKSDNSKSKKKYHVVKKGDTYWLIARKYGTTLAALRKLNPWPDHKIPNGVKMRIH